MPTAATNALDHQAAIAKVANLMLKRYSGNAHMESAARADELKPKLLGAAPEQSHGAPLVGRGVAVPTGPGNASVGWVSGAAG